MLKNLTTSEEEINIPDGAEELLIFVGWPNPGNEYQVYGGKPYVLPREESRYNVLWEQTVYNASGNASGSGVYASWFENNLIVSAKTLPVRIRVYYR